VRGQDAAPAASPADEARPVDVVPADPAQPAAEARPAADPTAARKVKAAPAEDVDAEAVRKLWDEKYATQIILVNDKVINRKEVEAEYLREVTERAGSEEAAKRLLNEAAVASGGEPPYPEIEPAPRRRAAWADDEDVDRAVVAQLERKLPEINFDGAGLSDVIDFLRDTSGANVVVEWKWLESAGLDRNTPVTLRVRNVSLAHALDLVLSSAAGGSVPLEYAIDRNVIRISTGDHLESLAEIRAYDVRDIVPGEMPMPQLAKLIEESVAPDSWRSAGGSVGSIHASKNKLIVTQNPMNHLQIKGILRMLREEPQEVPVAADGASAAQGPGTAR
jgi:hypothetical protein